MRVLFLDLVAHHRQNCGRLAAVLTGRGLPGCPQSPLAVAERCAAALLSLLMCPELCRDQVPAVARESNVCVGRSKPPGCVVGSDARG